MNGHSAQGGTFLVQCTDMERHKGCQPSPVKPARFHILLKTMNNKMFGTDPAIYQRQIGEAYAKRPQQQVDALWGLYSDF